MRFVVIVLLVARVAAADPVRLRVGTQAIDGSRYMKDIVALGKEIERRTRGAVELDWVSNGQLGDDAAMADQIADGKLDGGGLTETGLAALVPEMGAWGTPGLFRDYAGVDRATTALDGTIRELFAKHDLVFAMWADLGFAEVFSSEQIASLGEVLEVAAPWLGKPLDPKLTDAIIGGDARGWAVPPLFMLATGSRNARAMTTVHYRYVIGGLVLSRTAWAKLSAAEQKVVAEVCRTYEPKLRASWRKETERGIAALAKAGTQMTAPTDEELAWFATVMAKRRAKAGGKLLAKIGSAVQAGH